MDKDAIERIRTATFPMARRGYEKRDVERFLDQVADWLETGGGDDTRAESVRGELERVGQHITKILTEAHAAAEELKDEAKREVGRIRSDADAYAERVRIEAETYVNEQREEADTYGERRRAEIEAEVRELRHRADQEAEELTSKLSRRRAALEAEVADLEERRHEAVERMRRLSSLLAGTATEHDAPLTDAEEPAEPEGDELDEPEDESYESPPEDEPEAGLDVGETIEFDVQREFARPDREGSE